MKLFFYSGVLTDPKQNLCSEKHGCREHNYSELIISKETYAHCTGNAVSGANYQQ